MHGSLYVSAGIKQTCIRAKECSLDCLAQRRYVHLVNLKIDGETLSDKCAIAEDLCTNDLHELLVER